MLFAILARSLPFFLILAIGFVIWMIIFSIQQRSSAEKKIRHQIQAQGGSQIRLENISQSGDKNLFRIQASYVDQNDQRHSHRVHVMLSPFLGSIQEIIWVDPLVSVSAPASSSKEQVITDLSAENCTTPRQAHRARK